MRQGQRKREGKMERGREWGRGSVRRETHLSQYRIEYIKMRIEIDAIGRLQALGLVAFLRIHEYVQLFDDFNHTVCDFSAICKRGNQWVNCDQSNDNCDCIQCVARFIIQTAICNLFCMQLTIVGALIDLLFMENSWNDLWHNFALVHKLSTPLKSMADANRPP